MPCAECDAFIAAHKMATEHYSDVTARLPNMASDGEFTSTKYQRLKAEVEEARSSCEMAREALRVHREGHKIADRG